mgnify:CR=1 FL=1
MTERKDELIKKDSVVGDGDLGLTMSDGFTAAYNAIKDSPESDCGKMLYAAGKASPRRWARSWRQVLCMRGKR